MRTAYSPRERVAINFPERGKTVQYFKDECNINNILKKYETTGALWTTQSRPRYGDFTQVTDYASALDALRQADEAFQALSSSIRARFNNNPQEFVEFCSNKDNLEEMRRMGLAPEAQQIPPEIMANGGTEPAE